MLIEQTLKNLTEEQKIAFVNKKLENNDTFFISQLRSLNFEEFKKFLPSVFNYVDFNLKGSSLISPGESIPLIILSRFYSEGLDFFLNLAKKRFPQNTFDKINFLKIDSLFNNNIIGAAFEFSYKIDETISVIQKYDPEIVSEQIIKNQKVYEAFEELIFNDIQKSSSDISYALKLLLKPPKNQITISNVILKICLEAYIEQINNKNYNFCAIDYIEIINNTLNINNGEIFKKSYIKIYNNGNEQPIYKKKDYLEEIQTVIKYYKEQYKKSQRIEDLENTTTMLYNKFELEKIPTTNNPKKIKI